MKLGATVGMFAGFGEDRYKKMKEYGFDYADYSISGELGDKTEEEYEAMILADKALADEAGVTIWQIHGPWRYPPHDETPKLREERAEIMRRSIRMTAKIGCKYWVIHPVFPFGNSDFALDKFWQINEAFFKELVPYAKEYGVTVCFENMPMKKMFITTERSLEFIHKIGMDNMMLCLDTGHEAVFGLSVGDAVRRAGKDLAVLHIHDNDGLRDQHWLPMTGIIDFKDFYKALKEIEFDGVFSLETGVGGLFPNASLDTKIKAFKAVLDEIMQD